LNCRALLPPSTAILFYSRFFSGDIFLGIIKYKKTEDQIVPIGKSHKKTAV
jgi:hypothetical protein